MIACLSCSNETYCNSCESPKYLKADHKSCVDNCNILFGFYNDQSGGNNNYICQSCSNSIAFCADCSSANLCSVCSVV